MSHGQAQHKPSVCSRDAAKHSTVLHVIGYAAMDMPSSKGMLQDPPMLPLPVLAVKAGNCKGVGAKRLTVWITCLLSHVDRDRP